MSVTRLACFDRDGRRRGSFVFLLLCAESDGPLLAKLGVSDRPTRRLYELRAACRLPPARFAFVELGSRARARDVARGLAHLFEPWRTVGDGWLEVPPEEQPVFRAAWRFVLSAQRTAYGPPAVGSVDVPRLLAAGARL